MRAPGSEPKGGRRRGWFGRWRGPLVSLGLHASAFAAVAVTAESQRVRKPTRITMSEVVEEEKKDEPEPEEEPPPPPPPKPKKLSTETAPPPAETGETAAPKPLLDLGMLMSNSVDSGGSGGGLNTGVSVPVPTPGSVKPKAKAVEPTRVAKKLVEECTETPSKPEPLEKVEIEYPVAARQAGQEGRVVLRLFVNPDGSVSRVEVLMSAGELIDSAAIEAAKRWRFTPARACGKAVEGVYSLARRFELGD